MHADDGLVGESKQKVEERTARARRGMRISRSKMEYMVMTDQDQDRNRDLRSKSLDDQSLNSERNFRYLGSTVAVDENEDVEVTRRIHVGWKNWRDMPGALCDKKMPMKLKGKVYRTVMRPAMI